MDERRIIRIMNPFLPLIIHCHLLFKDKRYHLADYARKSNFSVYGN